MRGAFPALPADDLQRAADGAARLFQVLREGCDLVVAGIGDGLAHVAAGEALGLAADPVIEAGGWGVIKRYVEAGFGISAVPSLVLNETDRLAVVDLEWDDPPRSFGVYARTDRHLVPAARRFLSVLLPNLSVTPPAEG